MLFYNNVMPPTFFYVIFLQVMKDSQLFLVVGILLTIDIIIMSTWQVFDPFFRDVKNLRPYVSLLNVIFLIISK